MTFLKRLSEDIGFYVHKHDDEHFHCLIALILPELSGVVFCLYRWVYHVSFKEKMLEWEIQGKKLDNEEEALFGDIERLRKGEK